MKWRDVVGYEKYYSVSDTGAVFSKRSNKTLKQYKDVKGGGYYRVQLNVDGKPRRFSVHRLVAEAFVPNPNNYPVVNHKDETRTNNCADNLEWCTYKYNSNYGTCIERRRQHTEYHLGADNAKSQPVYQFDLKGNFIAEYGSAYEAARALKLNGKSISKARAGSLKQYAGFVWRETKEFGGYTSSKKHFRAGAVLQFDSDGNLIRKYNAPKETEEYGFDPNAVRDCCRGRQSMHKGYIFKYEKR